MSKREASTDRGGSGKLIINNAQIHYAKTDVTVHTVYVTSTDRYYASGTVVMRDGAVDDNDSKRVREVFCRFNFKSLYAAWLWSEEANERYLKKLTKAAKAALR